MDLRDRLILSLCALLRAERETRLAWHSVIATGQVSPDVLSAMLADPIPVITRDDLNFAEQRANAFASPAHARVA